MKKLICMALLFFSMPVFSSNTINYDVFENHRFVQYSDIGLRESTIRDMRGNTISDMESLINFECQTIADWYLPLAYKTFSNPISYSSNITLNKASYELASRLSDSIAFPFGLNSYNIFNKLIKEQINSGMDEHKAISNVKNICSIFLNPGKYKKILVDGNFNESNIELFKSIKEQEKGASLPLLTTTPKKVMKKITQSEISSFDIKDEEIAFSVLMIAEDIETGLLNQNIDNWVVYQILLDKKKTDFYNFLKKGGVNADYFDILVMAKLANIKHDYSTFTYDLNKKSLNELIVEKIDPNEIKTFPYLNKYKSGLKNMGNVMEKPLSKPSQR